MLSKQQSREELFFQQRCAWKNNELVRCWWLVVGQIKSLTPLPDDHPEWPIGLWDKVVKRDEKNL